MIYLQILRNLKTSGTSASCRCLFFIIICLYPQYGLSKSYWLRPPTTHDYPFRE